jgi:hypothetical protein
VLLSFQGANRRQAAHHGTVLQRPAAVLTATNVGHQIEPRTGFAPGGVKQHLERAATYRLFRCPERLEFGILSLNPGLAQRCVAPDV